MRRGLLAGLVAAILYLIGAAVTSHLRFGTPPLLDGLAPPPAYRWVKPPSDLAAANKRPFSGTFSLKFTGGRSDAGAFTTRDSQLSMILDPGALPPQAGVTAARIEVTPMAPSPVSQPAGYEVDGNVYRITIKEEPSGQPVKRFINPQRVILVYPADRSFVKPRHLLATSVDGKSWTRIETADSTVQQQASALIRSPGLIAVLVPEASESSGRTIVVYIVGAALLLLAAGGVGWWLYRRSRSRPRRR